MAGPRAFLKPLRTHTHVHELTHKHAKATLLSG